MFTEKKLPLYYLNIQDPSIESIVIRAMLAPCIERFRITDLRNLNPKALTALILPQCIDGHNKTEVNFSALWLPKQTPARKQKPRKLGTTGVESNKGTNMVRANVE